MKTKTQKSEFSQRPHHPFLWTVGTLFLFLAILFVIFNPLAAFPLFIVSAVYLPPARDFLYFRFDIDICKRCRVAISLFGIALFFLALESM